jgi:hypothetical protein
MESELLAGHAVQRRDQKILIDPDTLPTDLRSRLEAVTDSFMDLKVQKKRRICVLESGIDPELFVGSSDDDLLPLDGPIVEEVGLLPELPEPTDDVSAIVTAWESWMGTYQAQALTMIKLHNLEPPAVLTEPESFLEEELEWGSVGISFGEGLNSVITLEDGAEAIRDARAGNLWAWAASHRFSSESYAAAKEATDATPSEGRTWLQSLSPEKLARKHLERRRQLFQAAKAHHLARSGEVPDFEDEMRRWAGKQGSNRLQLGLEDGYRMNARYLVERLAAEAPGMFAMPARSAQKDWAYKAGSPSEQALELRRRIDAAIKRNSPPNFDGKPKAEIMVVKKPPHEMFLADPGLETEDGIVGAGLPSREAWPWRLDPYGNPVGVDPKPFEAVVVKHWLGRFHLIGAVGDLLGGGPPGIWARPDPDLYEEDGTVKAQDPDATPPRAAQRKPPEPEKEDDIPF